MFATLLRLLSLLAISGDVLLVEPPKDISIFCQNGNNSASWYHGDPSVTFLVVVRDYMTNTLLFNGSTSQNHMDLSSFTRPKGNDVYFLDLWAFVGSNVSNKVTSSFSYSRDLTFIDATCFMDLGQINMTFEEDRLQFNFINPGTVSVYDYNDETSHPEEVEVGEPYEMDEVGEPYEDEVDEQFHYSAYTSHDEKTLELQCPLASEVCQGEIMLKLSSIVNCTTLALEGYVDGIRYKSSVTFCKPVSKTAPWPIYIILVASVTTLALILFLIVCIPKIAKKLIEGSSARLPSFLKSRPIQRDACTHRPGCPDISVASRLQSGTTPLLQSPDRTPTEISPPVVMTPGTPEQTHFPISRDHTCNKISGDSFVLNSGHDRLSEPDDYEPRENSAGVGSWGDGNSGYDFEAHDGYDSRHYEGGGGGGSGDGYEGSREAQGSSGSYEGPRLDERSSTVDSYMQRERIHPETIVQMAPGDWVSGYGQ